MYDLVKTICYTFINILLEYSQKVYKGIGANPRGVKGAQHPQNKDYIVFCAFYN